MPRQRSPERDKARALWEADKSRPLVSIAGELGVPEGRIRKWKCEDQWEQPEKGTFRNAEKERERTESKKALRKVMEAVEVAEGLTEKEKAFCLHYVHTFNGAASVRRAGYETKAAKQLAWVMLQKPHIREEILRLKEIKNMTILGGKEDVLGLHWRIAFGDMTDFAEFDGDTVSLHPSDEVDGQLVQEVKQGKDGASIKLADRHKSLAFLERYFEMNPMDAHKKAYDEARLALEREKNGPTAPVKVEIIDDV